MDAIFVETDVAPLIGQCPHSLRPNMNIAFPGVTHSAKHLNAVPCCKLRSLSCTHFGMRYCPVSTIGCHFHGVGRAVDDGFGKFNFYRTVSEQMFYSLVRTNGFTKLLTVTTVAHCLLH